MGNEIQTIFKQKWKTLPENGNVESGNYPGVYLLAFTDKNLEGKVIKPKDIFYVGMSNARKGLSSRVRQFINGIEKNTSHSAGMRFYKEHSDGNSFSEHGHSKRFYIISLTFKCNVNKQTRTPKDLRTMGDISRLEYYLLAYIKEQTGQEPELNKK